MLKDAPLSNRMLLAALDEAAWKMYRKNYAACSEDQQKACWLCVFEETKLAFSKWLSDRVAIEMERNG